MPSVSQDTYRSDRISGLELALPLIGTSVSFKAIANESGIAFIHKKSQHNSFKMEGLSYEDDYKGDAVAIVFENGRGGVRYHKDFSLERIRNLVKRIAGTPQLGDLARAYDWHYHGEPVPWR